MFVKGETPWRRQGVSVRRIGWDEGGLPLVLTVFEESFHASDQPVEGWSQQHGNYTTDDQKLIPADCQQRATRKCAQEE